MGSSDFLRLTGCYLPCVQNEAEVIEYTEIKYPYFAGGANSLVLIVVSTNIIEIRFDFWLKKKIVQFFSCFFPIQRDLDL